MRVPKRVDNSVDRLLGDSANVQVAVVEQGEELLHRNGERLGEICCGSLRGRRRGHQDVGNRRAVLHLFSPGTRTKKLYYRYFR